MKVETGKFDWTAMHARLKTQLKNVTGKGQYYLNVHGTDYPYLPGVQDLRLKVEKFIEKYQMKDMDKIEKCLMRHLSIRNQKLIFYVIREKGDAKSDLAADYENFDDLKEVKNKGTGATISI